MDIKALSIPSDRWFDLYQRYYTESLKSFSLQSMSSFEIKTGESNGMALRLLRELRYSNMGNRLLKSVTRLKAATDELSDYLAGTRNTLSGSFNPLVGEYLISSGDKALKLCIDSQDSGSIASSAHLDWCDLYLKTNYWSLNNYSNKVLPLCNGNPLILDHLPRLQNLRKTKKEYDLCCIVRVWGGTDEVSGKEHNLRLLEAMSKVPGKKFLLAYLVSGNKAQDAKRLEKAGVPYTMKALPLKKLWQISAASRFNVLRLGMHYCIPWRFLDMLAMGTSIVLDRAPFTIWNEPMREHQDFLELGIDYSPNTPVADEADYARSTDRMTTFIGEKELSEYLSEQSAKLFDRAFVPDKLGGYLASLATRHFD